MSAPSTHEGELAVQQRAGEGRVTPVYGPEIPRDFVEFIRSQRMVVLGAADVDDDIWATILTGDNGFADPVDQTTISFSSVPAVGDPLREAFDVERDCGMIVLAPSAQRRIRANGRVRRHGERLVMRTQQVLRNCPKYIQRRELVEDADPVDMPRPPSTTGAELTVGQQKWIAESDTFFIASRSVNHGADASHRGGQPGFVTVVGPQELTWPDYKGNSFYMTFGNLALDPACGLVFVDWLRGHTLHLTGTARVDWDQRSAPGAIRTVRFEVKRVVQVDNATVLRWRFLEYSALNPNPTA